MYVAPHGNGTNMDKPPDRGTVWSMPKLSMANLNAGPQVRPEQYLLKQGQCLKIGSHLPKFTWEIAYNKKTTSFHPAGSTTVGNSLHIEEK